MAPRNPRKSRELPEVGAITGCVFDKHLSS